VAENKVEETIPKETATEAQTEQISENQVQETTETPEKPVEPETKLVNVEKKSVSFKIQGLDKNYLLNELTYDDCFKTYPLKLVIHLDTGKTLTKTIKVDLNDGIEARFHQIQTELLDQLNCKSAIFYVNNKELQLVEESSFSEKWRKAYYSKFIKEYEELMKEGIIKLALQFEEKEAKAKQKQEKEMAK
jgi:hypothetical protein